MSKKYFICTDVHGFYNELNNALKDKGWEYDNPNHIFISLGDLIDRGPDALKCLLFVNNLPKERKILIRGNHEDLMEDMIARGYHYGVDTSNGTFDSAKQLTGLDSNKAVTAMLNCTQWNTYIKDCINYYETDKNIFVHGWIPDGEDWQTGNWDDARWRNGMEYWDCNEHELDKTVFCGHWHTSYGHHYIDDNGSEFGEDAIFTPFIHKGIVALDACTAYTGFINCYVLEEDEF